MDQFLTLMKNEYIMFADEENNSMLRNLIEKCDGYASRVVEVEPLLDLIRDILKLSSTTICKGSHTDPVRHAMESLKKKIPSEENFKGLAKDIHMISCKISCKCIGEGIGDKNTVSVLLEMLSTYSWEAKLVLVMAAFAVSYGGFFFSLGVIGKEKWIPLQKLGEELIPAMVKLTESFIIAQKKLPSEYPLSSKVVRTTVYWTIKSVVACVPHIFGFLGLGHEYTPSKAEDKELCKLVDNLVETNEKIQAELKRYSELIEKKNIFEYRQKLELLFQQIDINISSDNTIMILKALIGVKNDNELPLVDIRTQERLGVKAVGKKNVLLLVSPDLTIYSKEMGILVRMYTRTSQQASDYQLVCFPMGNIEKANREEFEQHVKSKNLPWYMVHEDCLINKAVVEFIRDKWHFTDSSILAVLNAQGKLVNKNAFNNISILGGSSNTTTVDLSVTIKTVEECWVGATWGLQLLFQSIEEGKEVLKWINSNQLICLYGGEDTNWVTKFTKKAREVMVESRIQMVYVGARNQTNQVKCYFSEVQNQTLGDCSAKVASEFWARLQSMWQSRMEFITNASIDEEKDDIIKEIRNLLTYDSSEKGWAVICNGSKILVKAKGNVILECFEKFAELKKTYPKMGSIEIVIDYVKKKDTQIHCNRLIMPLNIGRISKDIKCENCPNHMQKFIMYRCCND